MTANQLDNKWYRLLERDGIGAVQSWMEELVAKQPDNPDVRYLYIDTLYYLHRDKEGYQKEPSALNLFTELIRGPNATITERIKAYTYRGYLKNYAIDRAKDADKALTLHQALNDRDAEG